jgi:hypothetical protein
MKNLFLVFACLFGASTTVFCQEKINTDDLIGYWMPDEESSQLFFWKDINGKLQVQEISGTSGEPFDLITLTVNKDSVFIRTIFMQNNWVTENVFTFINKTTLKCVVTGDGNGTLVFSKIK